MLYTFAADSSVESSGTSYINYQYKVRASIKKSYWFNTFHLQFNGCAH